MESLVLLAALLLILPLLVPVLWVQVSRLRKESRQTEERLRQLVERVYRLEKQLLEISKLSGRIDALEAASHLRAPVAAPAAIEIAAEKPAAPPPVPVAPPPVSAVSPPEQPVAAPPEPKPTPAPPAIPAPPRVPPPPSVPPATIVPPAATLPPAVSPATAAPPSEGMLVPAKTPAALAPPQPPLSAAPTVLPIKPAAAPPPPRAVPPPAGRPAGPTTGVLFPPSAPRAKPTRQEISRKAFDLEERLGTNWLSKLGIIILVFGIVFFLAYQLRTLGPLGKVIVGYAVSVTLLAVGVYLEHKSDYRILGRTGIGGGWALAYFVTYAMYHVSAARVLNSQFVDLVLLLAVAGAMVGHALRYDSQAVTGLAILLAFSTVTVSRETVYSLTAGAVLAAGLVVIVLRRRWYELEVFGLLASYLNHFLWLRSILAPLGPGRHQFPEFIPSTVLLLFYWAVFRVSYVLRRAPAELEEGVSTVACLLNTGLLLALLRYQSARPELAFWTLLGLGAIELALGQLPLLRRRRTAFLTLSMVGAALVVAAVPFRYSGDNVAALWLAEAEAFFVVGILIPEAAFRYFGALTAILTSLHLLAVDGWLVYQAREATGREPPELRLALLFAVAVAALYGNAHWAGRRWRALFESNVERGCLAGLSYLASALALAGVWLAFPGVWTAVGWAALALGAAMVSSQFEFAEVWLEGHMFAAAGFLWALGNNLGATQKSHGLTLRLITLTLIATLLYGAARWTGRVSLAYAREMSALYTWGGSLLVAILAWKELAAQWLAVAWAAYTLLLLLAGRVLKRSELRLQAHCLAAAAFGWALFNNFGVTQPFHGVTLRLVTVTLVAALFYVCTRWSAEPESRYESSSSAAYSWAGSALLTTLLWYELRAPSVALGWALFGLVLFELGWLRASASLRLQAYVAFAAAFLRIFFVNLNAESAPGELSVRLYTTLPVAAILYYAYGRIASGTEKYDQLEQSYDFADTLNYLGAIALAGLIRFELQPDWVSAGWSAMVLVFFAVAARSGARLLLEQGLLLSLAVLFRTLFYNFELPRYYPPGLWTKPSLTVGAAAGLLLLSLPFAFHLREKQPRTGTLTGFAALRSALARRPEQLLFFLPVGLVTALLALEMRKGLITLAWGLEGVAVFLFALTVKERSYRLTGLGLLLLCVAKILVVDVWSLSASDRYLTFIALGVALLLVSFLYTRYREALRDYL